MQRQAHVRTGDQALVREINLSLIMKQLHERAPISRAMLAERTGLNKATVSSLIAELIERRFVHETGLDTSGIGRPSVLLELNPKAGRIISGEIGVDFLYVICANFAAEVVWKLREEIQPEATQEEVLERIIVLIEEAACVPDCEREDVLGVALGLPGLVEEETGHLLYAPNLGWQDVHLRELLRSHFQVPIFINNEANMAALGEKYFGAAMDFDEVLYISAGAGLGGGIVREGKIFTGKSGFAGEFGHMLIEPLDDEACNGQGCSWEYLVSLPALQRYISQYEAKIEPKPGTPNQLKRNRLTLTEMITAAEEHDPIALKAFKKIGRYLGIGVASLVNALDPDLVVFGGELSRASAYILPSAMEEVERHVLSSRFTRTTIVRAKHGSEACVLGGVAAVYQTVLAKPASVYR